jgi:hypothetical protein
MKVLRRIYAKERPKKTIQRGARNLYFSPGIIKEDKRAGRVMYSGEIRNACRILVGKIDEKKKTMWGTQK